MTKKKFTWRNFFILAIFIAAIFIYGATLLNMQIANAEEYIKVIPTTYTRKFIEPVVRGEIYDRNGIPLVTNKNIYNIVIDGTKMPRTGYIEILIDLIDKINFYNGELVADTFPVMTIETGDGQDIIYSYSMMNTSQRNRLDRFLTKNKLNINTSANELVAFLTAKYTLDEYMPPETRDPKKFRTVLGVCYEFDRLNVLLGDNDYKISLNINNVLMSVIKENAHNYPGVEVRLTYERVYNIPTSAPHILGRIGPIPAGRLDTYIEKGYSGDAIVGISGAESAFEEYLRGIDGVIEKTYEQDGTLVSEEYIVEPVPGKDVYLTIDIKLQQVAEYSIGKTIGRIHELSKRYNDPKLNGEDANAGASVVISPSTGEILAIATYPSFDMLTYSEKYEELSTDEVNKPLLNRATMGQYEPGSVFKIVTSVAALCHGDLTTNEYIEDKGKYTKYQGYQPVCWYYPYTHGFLNVSEALQHSCNYYYYVVGERVGIRALNEYSRHLGFGEYTGVEIAETRGILASPEYKEVNGEVWTSGDLLQASIGQSDNVFSPLQMATMLGTVLNSGTRYKSHLLLCVKEYGSDEIYYSPEPTVVDEIEISETSLNAVFLGMKNVIEAGSAASLFNSFPNNFVGGKTGTAQVHVGKSSENGTFVAFAPFNKPEIAMSVVIEKGAKGTWAGFVSEDVLSYYFGYKTFEASMDLPEPTEEITETETEEVSEVNDIQ